jgi:hypothetical protein
MKQSIAIMHTNVLGYYYKTKETYDVFDPSPYDFIIKGDMDDSTALELVRICSESGVETAKAAWRLLN